MTSSDKFTQAVVKDTVNEVELLIYTSLFDAEKLKLMIFYAAQFPYASDNEKLLPEPINRSASSSIIFRGLQQ